MLHCSKSSALEDCPQAAILDMRGGRAAKELSSLIAHESRCANVMLALVSPRCRESCLLEVCYVIDIKSSVVWVGSGAAPVNGWFASYGALRLGLPISGGHCSHRHGWSVWRFGPILQNAGHKRGLHCKSCFSRYPGDAPSRQGSSEGARGSDAASAVGTKCRKLPVKLRRSRR